MRSSAARALALEAHARLTRFDPDSELSRLNRDPRPVVPVSPLLRRLARAVLWAGSASGGLVDATGTGVWRVVRTTADAVLRPPGVSLDGGGLAKGLVADLIAAELAHLPTFAVDCRGDLYLGGTDDRPRTIAVADPADDAGMLHRVELRRGAIATSGTTRQAGHLLDPRTGRPAATGILQATARAPSALAAEVRAKTALLRGRSHGPVALPDGGVLVTDLGEVLVVRP